MKDMPAEMGGRGETLPEQEAEIFAFMTNPGRRETLQNDTFFPLHILSAAIK